MRVVDANPKSREWKTHVAQEAGKIADGMLEGPLFLHAIFFRPRPASHFGTGKNSGVLKPSAPPYPITRPDTTKLLRAIEDAMQGVLYRDDAQIVRQIVSKAWGTPARCEIRIETVEGDRPFQRESEPGDPSAPETDNPFAQRQMFKPRQMEG